MRVVFRVSFFFFDYNRCWLSFFFFCALLGSSISVLYLFHNPKENTFFLMFLVNHLQKARAARFDALLLLLLLSNSRLITC